MKHHNSSKEIVLDFWRLAIGQRDLLFARQVISDHYIQHSATVKDGKEGVLESLEALAKIPKQQNEIKPPMRVIADHDFVAVHMLLEIGGRRFALLDLMRVQDGLLVEHWDAMQIIPDSLGTSTVDGPTAPGGNRENHENKHLITNYVHRALLAHENNNAQFIADNFIEHDPHHCLQRCSFDRLHRVIGEGDLVLSQTTGTIESKPYVLYDIFRVSEGRIAEHWNVHQLIPEKMPHNNKMV